VTEGEVVADGGDALVLEHLGRVLAEGWFIWAEVLTARTNQG